jgi:hypothetical protein
MVATRGLNTCVYSIPFSLSVLYYDVRFQSLGQEREKVHFVFKNLPCMTMCSWSQYYCFAVLRIGKCFNPEIGTAIYIYFRYACITVCDNLTDDLDEKTWELTPNHAILHPYKLSITSDYRIGTMDILKQCPPIF